MNELLDVTAAIDPRIVLVVLLGILDLWAAGLVVLSTASVRDKTLWVGILLLCPIIGCLFWFVFGPKWRPSEE